jgi:hypothetical protein
LVTEYRVRKVNPEWHYFGNYKKFLITTFHTKLTKRQFE